MKRNLLIEVLLLSLIVLLAFLLRLYKLDNPIADWHSWRQADTASVTKIFSEKGVNFLLPRYHDLSNIPSGKENPEGLRMVEAPIYNLIHLGVFRLAPGLGIDKAGRLTSVVLSLISLIFLYLIVRKLSGAVVGFFAAFIFAVLPFSIYYSRVILPEPLMITFFLISFYFFILNRKFSLVPSAVFLALALLVKPYAIFFTLPYLYLFARPLHTPRWPERTPRGVMKTTLTATAYFLIAITPLLLWRTWIKQFPEGIPASAWLYNINGIRLRPAWFRWLFAERLGKLILGYWGILVFGLGLALNHKVSWLYRLWFLGVIIYFVVFAGGNVTHDYYQAIIIPFIAVLLAVGFHFLIRPSKDFSKMISWPLAVFSLALMLFFSWYEIRGYYQINNWPIVEAGREADRILPKDAKVIAPYNGDTAFLYQTGRSGWPAITTSLTKMVNEYGASYYVSVNYDDQTNKIMNYTGNEIIKKTKEYVIVKLTAKTQP